MTTFTVIATCPDCGTLYEGEVEAITALGSFFILRGIIWDEGPWPNACDPKCRVKPYTVKEMEPMH